MRGLIFQRDVVRNDVLVKMLENLPCRFRLGIKQKRLAQVVDIRVGEDAPLGIEKEGVQTMARLHVLDVVGGHRMQQACPVFTRDADLAARGEIHPGSAGSQGFVGLHVQLI